TSCRLNALAKSWTMVMEPHSTDAPGSAQLGRRPSVRGLWPPLPTPPASSRAIAPSRSAEPHPPGPRLEEAWARGLLSAVPLRAHIRNGKDQAMSIKRHGVGPRLSQAVVHGDTVYLAGMVAADPSADG